MDLEYCILKRREVDMKGNLKMICLKEKEEYITKMEL